MGFGVVRWVSEIESGPTIVAEGLLSGTPIATPQGWCCAGTLVAGDNVLTFEGGVQPLTHVPRLSLSADVPPVYWPLLVPAFAFGNRAPLLVLPDQKLLIEADRAEVLYGEPFALVPAVALDGWRGVARHRLVDPVSVVQLGFDAPQIVYASRGLLMACAGDALSGFGATDPVTLGPVALGLEEARELIACIVAEEAGVDLRQAIARAV